MSDLFGLAERRSHSYTDNKISLSSESTEAQRPFLAVFRELHAMWGNMDAQTAADKKLKRITITIDIEE